MLLKSSNTWTVIKFARLSPMPTAALQLIACANLLKFSPPCRLKEMNLPQEPYEWYIDLRRHGTVKHAGFGLGFERMILFATGLENIRDAIPFPRYPGKAEL